MTSSKPSMSQEGHLEDLLVVALTRSSSASSSSWLNSRRFHSSLKVLQGCKLALLLLDRHAARRHMQVLQYPPPPPLPPHLQSSSSPPEGHLCHNKDPLTSDIKPTMFQEWHTEDLPVAALRSFATSFQTGCASYTHYFLPCPQDDCWLKYTVYPLTIQVCVLVHNLQIYVSQCHEHNRCMWYARMPRELPSKPYNIVF